jgi:hypothetical protein
MRAPPTTALPMSFDLRTDAWKHARVCKQGIENRRPHRSIQP